MVQRGSHQGLELRLQVLGERIGTLKDKMSRAEGLEKIEALGYLDRLQRRYNELKEQLEELNREGPGFRQDAKNELEKLSYDLSGTVEDFITWADSDYHPEKRPPKVAIL